MIIIYNAVPSLLELGLKVLNTNDADEKAKLTIQIYNDWLKGDIKEIYSRKDMSIPKYSARPKTVVTVHPSKVNSVFQIKFQLENVII